MESRETAQRRGIVDAAIVAVLFQAGLRRCEAKALVWADIEDAADGEGVLVHVRASKSNQEGAAADTRYVKGGSPRTAVAWVWRRNSPGGARP